MIMQETFDKFLKRYEEYVKSNTPKTMNERTTYINEQTNCITMLIKLMAVSAFGIDVDKQVVTNPNATNRIKSEATKLVKDIVSKTVQPQNENTTSNVDNKIKEDATMATKKTTSEKPTSATTKKTATKKTVEPVEKESSKTVSRSTAKKPTVKKTFTAKKSTSSTAKKPVAKKSTVADKNAPAKKSTRRPKSIDRIEADAKMAAIEKEIEGKSAADIISEELINWGISPDSFGYKALVRLPRVFKVGTAEYSTVIAKLSVKTGKSTATVSSAIANLVKKADFSKAKYIPVLAKMDKKNITKEKVVAELLEFCDTSED